MIRYLYLTWHYIASLGDDAVGVTWMDIDGNMELYASHKSFIEKVVHKRGGHW